MLRSAALSCVQKQQLALQQVAFAQGKLSPFYELVLYPWAIRPKQDLFLETGSS